MRTVTFEVSRIVPQTPAAIAARIADTDSWSTFDGYGPLPGIERAEYETRTPEMAGSRIRVYNADGSNHVEAIEEWAPGERIVIRLGEFQAPLSRIASHFVEHWRFEECGAPDGGTLVSRRFEMIPHSPLMLPALWLISRLMRGAVDRHMQRLVEER
ncbi:MAG: SRPBCC family protein [Candidatus Promineifilaceae bacterium]|nr:SRPBCC family protein [Candidatus Promineifilaceae bacterium]